MATEVGHVDAVTISWKRTQPISFHSFCIVLWNFGLEKVIFAFGHTIPLLWGYPVNLYFFLLLWGKIVFPSRPYPVITSFLQQAC